MSAKEMFEELGYEQIIDKEMFKIIYKSILKNTSIEFDEIIITIRVSQNEQVYAQTLNVYELAAINKQVEELGWISKEGASKGE